MCGKSPDFPVVVVHESQLVTGRDHSQQLSIGKIFEVAYRSPSKTQCVNAVASFQGPILQAAAVSPRDERFTSGDEGNAEHLRVRCQVLNVIVCLRIPNRDDSVATSKGNRLSVWRKADSTNAMLKFGDLSNFFSSLHAPKFDGSIFSDGQKKPAIR